MKKSLITLILVMLLCSFAAAYASDPIEVNVLAAASLTDSLNKIIENYSKSNPDVKIIPVYESSGTLRKQIEEGADADIFLSANEKHMNTLADENLIDKDSRIDLLGNDLTLIASKETAEKLASITDFKSILTDESVKTIAIGEPTDVPAGQYAKESLDNLKIWDTVSSKLVYGKNVKAVLTYVDSGNADLGFVYKTDAMLLKSGKILMNVPADSYTAVNYPAALLKNAKQPESAKKFFEYLGSDDAKAVFEKYGFTFLKK